MVFRHFKIALLAPAFVLALGLVAACVNVEPTPTPAPPTPTSTPSPTPTATPTPMPPTPKKVAGHLFWSPTGGSSAGCQVFRSSKDFYEFMDTLDYSADMYGNSFTYTLIEESDLG